MTAQPDDQATRRGGREEGDEKSEEHFIGLDPAERDEVPPCWTDDAREIGGAFSFGEGVRPWNWLELDREDAGKLWLRLISFVSYFNRRYGEHLDKRVPPCWAEHGALVEELTTLMLARWQAFESPHASIGGAQYWHAYTLPAFTERIAQWLGSDLLFCQQGRHRDRDERPLDTLSSWGRRTEVIAVVECSRRSDLDPSDPGARSGVRPRMTIEIPFLDDPEARSTLKRGAN